MSFDYDARAIGAISPAGVREHADNLVRLLRNEREDLVSPSSPHLTESVLRVSFALQTRGSDVGCADVSISCTQKDRNRPIVFVVHSLGGIVVKQARPFPSFPYQTSIKLGRSLLTPKVFWSPITGVEESK